MEFDTRMLGVDYESTCRVKGSEKSPGLLQDFEDGYVKVSDSPSYCTVSLTWSSGYDCKFQVRRIPV